MRHDSKDPRREAAGRRQKGLSARYIRSDMEMAGSPQKRTEARQVLPIRVWSQMRLRLRQSLPLRKSRVTWNRYVLDGRLKTKK